MLRNFSWVVPDELAGMAQPGECGHSAGSVDELGQDLDALVSEGVGALVSLSEDPLHRVAIAQRSLRYLHLPIPDMSAPSVEEIDRGVSFIARARGDDLAVAVHCRAGMGRTGTLLACCLVESGHSPTEAMAQLRASRPGSIETHDQELAVHTYSEYCRARSRA